MDVIIDSKEKNRVKKGKDFFMENGHNVTVESLGVGDYLFDGQVVFEYKKLDDFISSVNDGRVFNQAINQFELFPFHYVIIEVSDKKLSDKLQELYFKNKKDRFSKKKWVGAVASLNSFTNVIFAPTERKCFELMELQASKCLESSLLVRKVPKSTGNIAFKVLCYCVGNVGEKKAELIVDELGLVSYRDVLGISYADLIKIKGIGDKTASNIVCELGNNE